MWFVYELDYTGHVIFIYYLFIYFLNMACFLSGYFFIFIFTLNTDH